MEAIASAIKVYYATYGRFPYQGKVGYVITSEVLDELKAKGFLPYGSELVDPWGDSIDDGDNDAVFAETGYRVVIMAKEDLFDSDTKILQKGQFVFVQSNRLNEKYGNEELARNYVIVKEGEIK